MSRAERARSPGTPPPADGLERLIEMEARLTAQQRVAAAEAERILGEARGAVAALEAREDDAFASQAEATTARISQARDAEIARLKEATEARAARLAATPAERIAELARWAVEQVLASSEEGAGP